MRGFTAMQERFGFTRNELIVITLLACSFLAGLGVRWLGGSVDPSSIPVFDYARADSIFAARSVQPLTSAESGRAVQRVPAPKLRPGDVPVDINAATREQLMRLPGVGPGLADRILAYRTEHRRFKSVDELTAVSGIGTRTLERIRPLATTHDSVPPVHHKQR